MSVDNKNVIDSENSHLDSDGILTLVILGEGTATVSYSYISSGEEINGSLSIIVALPGHVMCVNFDETAAMTTLDDKTALTATVEPNDADDKTVKWTVSGNAVKLYSDADCTTEVGNAATDTLTVYAKGVSAGTATVKVESNADSTKNASCEVAVLIHSYDKSSFAGSGDTITATCKAKNCSTPRYQATMTIHAPARTVYGGSESEKATITQTGIDQDFLYVLQLKDYTADELIAYMEDSIEYYQGETKLDAEPVDAGNYTANRKLLVATPGGEEAV